MKISAPKMIGVVWLVWLAGSTNADQALLNTATLSGEVPIKTWKTLRDIKLTRSCFVSSITYATNDINKDMIYE